MLGRLHAELGLNEGHKFHHAHGINDARFEKRVLISDLGVLSVIEIFEDELAYYLFYLHRYCFG
jgi:hypothetical protein